MFVLDCTLRDGGYYNNWNFSEELVNRYLKAMEAAGVSFVELGLRKSKSNKFVGASGFTTDCYLHRFSIPKTLKVAVMVNAADLLNTPDIYDELELLFPNDSSNSPVDLVRVACHVHEFEAALVASTWLKKRGFLVGFNIMQIAERTSDEIEALARCASSYEEIDVLYFADSMGGMEPNDIVRVIQSIRQEWQGEIGIHAHDNLGLALVNTLAANDVGVTWLDSTVTGMGRGPGNTRTEELVFEAAERLGRKLELIPLMQLIEKYFSPMKKQYGWGSNSYYYLSGKYGIHPTYVQEMIADSRYDEADILAVLDYLKMNGGAKFSPSILNEARNFYRSESQGSWKPIDLIKGRRVLILGAGPGVKEHLGGIEDFIRRENPIVVALNTKSIIPEELIDIRFACHPVRLLSDCKEYMGLPQPLVTPFSSLPTNVCKALKGKSVLDFGINVQENKFSFSETSAVLPNSLVISYALAICTSGKATDVLLAGFDGYGADDPRTSEMESLFSLYLSQEESCEVTSITPTRYSIPVTSVYLL